MSQAQDAFEMGEKYAETMRSRNQWLDQFHAARNLLNGVSNDLDELASHFYATGNTMMYDTLMGLASAVSNATDAANKAISLHINQEYVSSQKQLGETFSAILKTFKQEPQP